MSGPRETAYAALFALVSGAYAWASPPSRRVKLWGDVPLGQRPALFQYEGSADKYSWANTALSKRTIAARLFVYTDAKDTAKIGAQQLNDITDAIDAAMRASPADRTGRNTLGGAVFQARIDKIDREPGDLDGDGMAIVDIEIILP